MATIAIGDIHGNLAALEDLLGKVLPELQHGDQLVFLGDYVDRGPDSRGCLERIVRLKKECSIRVVGLLGNHEMWMLNSRRDPTRHSWLFTGQGFSTIKSYSREAAEVLDREIKEFGPRLLLEKVPLSYEAFFRIVPHDHIEFFEGLKPYHETEDALCVHGGVALDGRPLNSQGPSELIWGPDGFPEEYRAERSVVYGHHDSSVERSDGWPLPRILPNGTFGIDTISKGVLTAMRFPDGKIFQSDIHLFDFGDE